MVRLDRLSPEVTIGRGRENTIWLDHPTVSRDHARIDYFRGRCTIYDRNSMNGIEVDGREVRKSPITPGLLVRCGECEIEVLPDPRIDLNAGLSRLRMLLHQEPSEACWNALSAALVSWPDTPELDLALDYVVQHLDESEAWAAYTRSAPQMWRSTLQNILQRQPELEDGKRFMSRMTSCVLGPRDPRWRIVERLELNSCHMGSEGVRLLGLFPMLSELSSLSLGDNRLGDHGVRALLESDHLGNMHHLDLWSNSISDEGALLLANAWNLESLQTLNLGNNAVGRAGASALQHSKAMPNLSALHLEANPSDPFHGHAFGMGHRVRMSLGNMDPPNEIVLPRHLREQVLTSASNWPLRPALLEDCSAHGLSVLLVLMLGGRPLALTGLRQGESIVVGSGVETTWRLVQDGLSPQHVCLKASKDASGHTQVTFTDLQSSTGTYLYGRRVTQGVLGDYTFVEIGAEWRVVAIFC